MPDDLTDRAPRAGRPDIKGYGIARSRKGLLDWASVSERIAQARNYWIATAAPDGEPHAVPVWGIWAADTLFFDGGRATRWVRNLANNPRAAAHLESAEQVIIIEGSVERLERLDAAVLPLVAAQSEAKYGGTFQDNGSLALRPRVVFAWNNLMSDATRFVFEAGPGGVSGG